MSYQVAVRALRIHRQVRRPGPALHPAPTALEGMAGHALVAARRGEGYQSEVALAGEFRNLRVRAAPTATTPRATAWKR